MADNTTTGTGVPVATRSVTYSGDAAQNMQVVALATVAGADDAKTATDLALGQTTMSASLPVTIASNQTVIPVSDNSGSITVDDGGGGGSLTVDDGGASLTVDAPVGTPVFVKLSDGSASLVGQKAMSASLPVALASDQTALSTLGSVPTAIAYSWTSIAASYSPIAVTGLSVVFVRLSGASAVGVATLTFEGSDDGTSTYFSIVAQQVNSTSAVAPITSITGTAIASNTLLYRVDVSGLTHFRGTLSAVLTSGSVSVRVNATAAPLASLHKVVTQATSTNLLARVDNAGTFAVQDSEKLADNAGFTDGATKVVPVGYIFDETAGTALTENDIGAARMDAKRASVGVIEDATTRGQRAAVSAAGRLSVDASGVAVPITDNAGSLTVDGTVAVAGTVAHDGSTANNPVTVGGRAIAHGANPTAVAAADVTDAYYNRAGVQFTIGGHPNIVTIKHTTITTAVTDAAVVTVAGGLKIVVTSFMFTLDNASTVFPTVLLGFAAANTPTTTGVIGAHGGVPAGGGFGRGDGSGIIGIGADGEDLRVTTTGNATGNGLQLVVSYFTIES